MYYLVNKEGLNEAGLSSSENLGTDPCSIHIRKATSIVNCKNIFISYIEGIWIIRNRLKIANTVDKITAETYTKGKHCRVL